jgi:hypothetical protein
MPQFVCRSAAHAGSSHVCRQVTPPETKQPTNPNALEMIMRATCSSIFAVLFCLALSGCGNRVNLQGKVTFSDDGSPLTCGMVLFDDGQIVARGPIGSDGTYAVGVERDNDGIPPGTYKVSIVDAAETIPSGSEYVPPSYKKLIDDKYFFAESSELQVTVEPSTKRFDIVVDRAK